MKILWITNTLFPDVCNALGFSTPVVGGWMYSGAKSLLNLSLDLDLAVAALYPGKEFKRMELNGIIYFLIPQLRGNEKHYNRLGKYWNLVQHEFNPDVIHIHGSEYTHGFAYVEACGSKNVIVSIQGLVSVYEKYYFGGISRYKLLQYLTIRDIIRLDSIFSQHKNMTKRGQFEKRIIQSVKHVIGRTKWDRAHSWAINSKVKYHFCNETLRNDFYSDNWNLNNCEKFSIFLSQAHYPIKGLQQIIKALPLIIRHYPSTNVYVAGNDFIHNKRWRIGGFGKFIKSLIRENKVEERIIFTGLLNERQMKERYLKSHVFVCPSSIENSPNSVGEAQLLGLPCVASYVGGVADMIIENETGLLYRFEETEMLAKVICRIFEDDSLAISLSQKGKKIAAKRHNQLTNSKKLYSIYEEICKNQ